MRSGILLILIMFYDLLMEWSGLEPWVADEDARFIAVFIVVAVAMAMAQDLKELLRSGK